MNASLRDALGRFMAEGQDPVEGALIVARIIAPAADVDWAREEIARLAASVGRAAPKPADVVATLAQHGFQGAAERYYEVENSVLDHVLRSRRGIPISLGVVLMGVCRQLDLKALGVNFPRHFLVVVDDLLVDPYQVAPTTVEACRKWLKENKVSEDGAFNIATPRDIVLGMLNNVRMIVQSRQDYLRGLEISDYQLLIEPDAYGLYVERADAWLGLNAPEMVVTELQRAAERAPDEAIATRLRERIEHVRRLKSPVN